MRRGGVGVGVGVLRVFIFKVYAQAPVWHAAVGALLAGRGDLLGGERGIDAVTGYVTAGGRMLFAAMFVNCDVQVSPVQSGIG